MSSPFSVLTISPKRNLLADFAIRVQFPFLNKTVSYQYVCIMVNIELKYLLTYPLLSIWSTKTPFDELVKSWSDHYVLRQKEAPPPPKKKKSGYYSWCKKKKASDTKSLNLYFRFLSSPFLIFFLFNKF